MKLISPDNSNIKFKKKNGNKGGGFFLREVLSKILENTVEKSYLHLLILDK